MMLPTLQLAGIATVVALAVGAAVSDKLHRMADAADRLETEKRATAQADKRAAEVRAQMDADRRGALEALQKAEMRRAEEAKRAEARQVERDEAKARAAKLEERLANATLSPDCSRCRLPPDRLRVLRDALSEPKPPDAGADQPSGGTKR